MSLIRLALTTGLALYAAGCTCINDCEPAIVGLCDEVLVAGEQYLVFFGTHSDTGLFEATVSAIRSDAPATIDGRPAPEVEKPDNLAGNGAGGVLLDALAPGEASVSVWLRGYDGPTVLDFQVVSVEDAPPGFVSTSAEVRLESCLSAEDETGPLRE